MAGEEPQPELVSVKVRAADAALSAQDVLSDAEHDRLASMHPGARPSFVTARTMLRHMLGEQMGLLPAAVPLLQEGAGQVMLDGFDPSEPPFFSVSHTGGAEDGIAAVAVSETSPIGIDIQQIDPTVNWRRIAERRLPDAEAALVLAMPETEGQMLFFTLWAIKESFVKLEDGGALMPYLRQIELDMTDGRFALKTPTPGGLTDAAIHFTFEPEHRLAVAAVAAKPVTFNLDCEIILPSRRSDPLQKID